MGKLSNSERKLLFASGLAKGQSPKNAALAAGFAPSYANTKAYLTAKSPEILELVGDIRDGVTRRMGEIVALYAELEEPEDEPMPTETAGDPPPPLMPIRRVNPRMLDVVLDAMAVINEIGAIAMVAPTDFLVEDERDGVPVQRWRTPDELTPMQRAAIRSVSIFDEYERRQEDGKPVRVFVGRRYSYVLHDKLKALELLGKHYKLLGDEQPPPPPGTDFTNVPHEKVVEAMSYLNKLLTDGAVDGEVLSDDRGQPVGADLRG